VGLTGCDSSRNGRRTAGVRHRLLSVDREGSAMGLQGLIVDFIDVVYIAPFANP